MSSPLTEDLETEGTTIDSAHEKTLTGDEDEALQCGRKGREQFNEALAGYKQKKLKKKISADTQLVQFAERELQLRERMFEKLESVSEEQTKTMSLLTTQLLDLTKTMSSAFMLLQQNIQMSNPFPYQPYGVPYAPSPSPHQNTTPSRHSGELYDSQLDNSPHSLYIDQIDNH